MSIISKDIQKAVTLLNNEDIVAIPTETVYGLAGNIFSEIAIKKIFSTKKRPLFNPLIVHIGHLNALKHITTELPEVAKKLAAHFWPGPMTLVLPKHNNIPNIITANKNTVAVRMPNHPVTLKLLNAIDFPLAAPSANPFNRISPTKAAHVAHYFKDTLPMVLDGGACTSGIESTIIGFENNTPVIYRLGALPLEDIENLVGKVIVKNKNNATPEAPGMLKKHYSPLTKTILSTSLNNDLETYSTNKIGLISFSKSHSNASIVKQITLSKTKNLAEASAKLYSALHDLDQLELDVIIVEKMPNFGLGNSINDRLERACS